MPGTVTIGCKLPSGVHLNIFTMEDSQEPIMGGGWRVIKKASFAGRVTIKGVGRRVDDPRVVGGYALTPNVDADVWAEWLKQNKDSDLVKNRMVFAHVKQAEAEAQARDQQSLRSGLEPVDPGNLPPEFKRKIETAQAV